MPAERAPKKTPRMGSFKKRAGGEARNRPEFDSASRFLYFLQSLSDFVCDWTTGGLSRSGFPVRSIADGPLIFFRSDSGVKLWPLLPKLLRQSDDVAIRRFKIAAREKLGFESAKQKLVAHFLSDVCPRMHGNRFT